MKNTRILFLLVGLLCCSQVALYAQWTKVILPNPPGNHGALPGRVYALESDGTNLYAGTLGGNIYRSPDNGSTWTYIDTNLTYSDINCIKMIGNKLYVATYGSGVYTSTNQGKTWVASNSTLTTNTVYSLVSIDSTVFASTWGGGVFATSLNSSTWAAVNTGLTNMNVRSLGVEGPRLFAGTWGDGVFLSDDKGSTWMQSNTGISKLYIYAFASGGPNIYLGNDDGVYSSANYGYSWTLRDSGLTTSYTRTMIFIDPKLIIGTSGQGVFVSQNQGTTWSIVDTGLTDGYIYSLAINNSRIFAGSTNGEIWSRPLNEVTGIRQQNQGVAAKGFALSQNYPNPFNPTTNITYQLPQNGLVNITVYNTLGQAVKTLVNENQSAGSHSITFDASSLPSGVYLYQLNAGAFNASKKMILMK